MNSIARDLALGAVAGAAATAPMSVLMWIARKAGIMGQQPPEKITAKVLDSVDVHPSDEAKHRLSLANHVLFGAVAGSAFGVGRRWLPYEKAEMPSGIAFGLLVWLVSYQGWVPALNIMAPASNDGPGRPTTMAIAHIVFGASLTVILRRLHRVISRHSV